jgi:hypothetical protein
MPPGMISRGGERVLHHNLVLEKIRETYREGRVREAYAPLQKLREEGYWDILEQSLRGRILRTLVGYVLHAERDISKARVLADKACSIDPTADDNILCTLLKYYVEGAESALLKIGVSNSLDVFNLKIALLLELGRVMDIEQHVGINGVHARLLASDEGHQREEDFVACVQPPFSTCAVAPWPSSPLARQLKDLE